MNLLINDSYIPVNLSKTGCYEQYALLSQLKLHQASIDKCFAVLKNLHVLIFFFLLRKVVQGNFFFFLASMFSSDIKNTYRVAIDRLSLQLRSMPRKLRQHARCYTAHKILDTHTTTQTCCD